MSSGVTSLKCMSEMRIFILFWFKELPRSDPVYRVTIEEDEGPLATLKGSLASFFTCCGESSRYFFDS